MPHQLAQTKMWTTFSIVMAIKYSRSFGFPRGHRQTCKKNCSTNSVDVLANAADILTGRSSKSQSLIFNDARMVSAAVTAEPVKQLSLFRLLLVTSWTMQTCHHGKAIKICVYPRILINFKSPLSLGTCFIVVFWSETKSSAPMWSWHEGMRDDFALPRLGHTGDGSQDL